MATDPVCYDEENNSVALCETESNSSSDTSASLTPSSRKSVCFQHVEIKEYNITLGDHPSVTQGPPVTIEWDPVRSHIFTVDDYENGFTEDARRRGQELRMPVNVRKSLLSSFHSEKEMLQARLEARKVQSQRKMSKAMEDMEAVTSVVQSATRKYKKWMRKRLGVEPEPAEVWIKAYKDATAKERQFLQPQRAKSWHACENMEVSTSNTSKHTSQRKSMSMAPIKL